MNRQGVAAFPADAATPASADGSAQETLQSLQVMRGIAAIAVVFYHTHLYVARPDMGGLTVFRPLATFGWMGVSFFFVLSGFIILLAHERDIGVPARAGRYLWRRFSRVYPIYWLFLTAYIAASWMGFGSPEFSWEPSNLLASYALVQLGAPPTLPLKVAWTLFYEVAFYSAFLAIILNRFWGGALIGLWAAVVLVNVFVLGNVDNGWYLHIWNFYFLVGAGTLLAFRRIDPRGGVAILLAGLALLVVAAASGFVDPRIHTFQQKPLPLLLMSIPFALILLGAVCGERHHDWRFPRVSMLLGDASYAIYLTHSAVISVIAPVLHGRGPDLPPTVHFLVIVTLAVAAGTTAHILLERPLLRSLRSVVGSRRVPSHIRTGLRSRR